MSLKTNRPIGSIPTLTTEAARDFYTNIVGLAFESDNQFALVFRIGPAPGTMLRVVRTPSYTPPPFTTFGWEVDDIHASVTDLKSRGRDLPALRLFATGRARYMDSARRVADRLVPRP